MQIFRSSSCLAMTFNGQSCGTQHVPGASSRWRCTIWQGVSRQLPIFVWPRMIFTSKPACGRASMAVLAHNVKASSIAGTVKRALQRVLQRTAHGKCAIGLNTSRPSCLLSAYGKGTLHWTCLRCKQKLPPRQMPAWPQHLAS